MPRLVVDMDVHVHDEVKERLISLPRLPESDEPDAGDMEEAFLQYQEALAAWDSIHENKEI